MSPLLASDAKVALDEVYRSARKLAAAYRDAAELVDDLQLAQRFRDLASSRGALVDDVAEHAGRAGDGAASEPNEDRLQLARIGRRIKAAVLADAGSALLRDRLRDETELDVALEHALEVELPEATRRAVRRWRASVNDARRRLAAPRHRPERRPH